METFAMLYVSLVSKFEQNPIKSAEITIKYLQRVFVYPVRAVNFDTDFLAIRQR